MVASSCDEDAPGGVVTHITHYALAMLWMGMSLDEFWAWNDRRASPMAHGAPCGALLGSFVETDSVHSRVPTCPACAVLADMARGAE